MKLRWSAVLGIAVGMTGSALGPAIAADSIVTRDPVGLFVREGDTWVDVSDFFIHGKENTILFRVIQDVNGDGIKDLALSEISIWGNKTGDWVIFRGRKDGSYSRDVRRAGQTIDQSLMEWAATRAHDTKNGYRWKRGYPSEADLERYAPFKVPHRPG